MKIIVAVDDSFGMLFNHRRQSQDSILRQKVLALCKGSLLRMNDYSRKQFADCKGDIIYSEEFLKEAQDGDYCFVENQNIAPFGEKIEELTIFHWNRKYPGDFFLDYLPEEHGMNCVKEEDIVGNSHERITMEVWRK